MWVWGLFWGLVGWWLWRAHPGPMGEAGRSKGEKGHAPPRPWELPCVASITKPPVSLTHLPASLKVAEYASGGKSSVLSVGAIVCYWGRENGWLGRYG